ncbi:hypothetical protein HU200_062685 [Digitaria exilis]|uniref:RING-type E3 ubiquitin transferase n=1 Tax=Digitaria exilis TaxID=1010633 RepID=A0A835A947_9POAL|nr:hypothetical protein HU200_062685 [Digitaria exilis]
MPDVARPFRRPGRRFVRLPLGLYMRTRHAAAGGLPILDWDKNTADVDPCPSPRLRYTWVDMDGRPVKTANWQLHHLAPPRDRGRFGGSHAPTFNSFALPSPQRKDMSSTTPRHGGRRALLACALAAAATAQTPSLPSREDDSGHDQEVSTAMVALLAAVVAVFVFIAVSTIYLRHCTGYNYNIDAAGRSPAGDDAAFSSSLSWWHRHRRRRRGSSRGLDAEAIEAFPTMTYAEAKALRVGKQGGGALECAVCLSEFEDGDKLRLLLPKCSHAFHPDCIAQWLAGHVTCPVCRCNLQPSYHEEHTSISNDGEQAASFQATIPLASSVSSETAAAAWQDGGSLPVAVVIDVVTEEEMELQRIGTQRRAMRSSRSGTPAAAHDDGAARRPRFTLRLPEHVSREMLAAAASRGKRGRRKRPQGAPHRSDEQMAIGSREELEDDDANKLRRRRGREGGEWPQLLMSPPTLPRLRVRGAPAVLTALELEAAGMMQKLALRPARWRRARRRQNAKIARTVLLL